MKKDERVLRTFIQRYIQLPLPDYGARHLLLHSFARVRAWGPNPEPERAVGAACGR